MGVRRWYDAIQVLVSLYWVLWGGQVRAGRELSVGDDSGVLVMMMKKLHNQRDIVEGRLNKIGW